LGGFLVENGGQKSVAHPTGLTPFSFFEGDQSSLTPLKFFQTYQQVDLVVSTSAQFNIKLMRNEQRKKKKASTSLPRLSHKSLYLIKLADTLIFI